MDSQEMMRFLWLIMDELEEYSSNSSPEWQAGYRFALQKMMRLVDDTIKN